MNQLADRQLAGVQLTLPDNCSISAADSKPTLVLPSRSACGSQATVRECPTTIIDKRRRHQFLLLLQLSLSSLRPIGLMHATIVQPVTVYNSIKFILLFYRI